MEISNKIIYILKRIKGNIDVSNINEETDLILDLDLDSIDILEFISIIESEFNVNFENIDMVEIFSSFGKLCNYIMQQSVAVLS